MQRERVRLLAQLHLNAPRSRAQARRFHADRFSVSRRPHSDGHFTDSTFTGVSFQTHIPGELRDRLDGALIALSTRLLRLRASDVRRTPLWTGLAGVALAQRALETVFPARGHIVLAQHALERTLARVGRAPLGEGLSGLVGVGWVVARLAGSEAEVCTVFDDAFEADLSRRAWRRPYDLINGIVGYGVYGLQRLPRPSGRRIIDRVVHLLERLAVPQRLGIAWWSDPGWLPRDERRRPNLDWNLGMAHGVPGVVAFLARVVASDVDVGTGTRARALLREAAAWILSTELPPEAGGRFTDALANGLPGAPTRLAWCYGDAGVASSLFSAARAVGDQALESEGLRIARHAATRSESTADVFDAGVCHGALGLSHVFRRLFVRTGDAVLLDASLRWLERGLSMRSETRGFGGFLAHRGVDRTSRGAWPDPSLLGGASGIAVVLSAISQDADSILEPLLLLP